MGFRTSAPAPNLGYNRTTDWPSGGSAGGGTSGSGGGLSGMLGLKNTAVPGGPGNFHPTIAWMFGFVIVEMIAFGLLARHLKL
jgi:hypothetical protein